MDRQQLRALERAVLRMSDEGLPVDEIGRRLRRSPTQVERIMTWATIPRPLRPPVDEGLRPLERRVLQMRSDGLDHDEIARRFRRSPDHMRRVEDWARLRQELHTG